MQRCLGNSPEPWLLWMPSRLSPLAVVAAARADDDEMMIVMMMMVMRMVMVMVMVMIMTMTMTIMMMTTTMMMLGAAEAFIHVWTLKIMARHEGWSCRRHKYNI